MATKNYKVDLMRAGELKPVVRAKGEYRTCVQVKNWPISSDWRAPVTTYYFKEFDTCERARVFQLKNDGWEIE